MKSPKISIVLPTYNGSLFLRKSLNSCLSQTYQNWELIIVNDCSTDETLKIANEYAQKDKRICIISNETNKKLPASLNIGFGVATGDYLTWTSDDNYYVPNALEKMSDILNAKSEIDFVYADKHIIDGKDKILSSVSSNEISDLYRGCCIGACFLYRREILNRFGGYDINLFCAEDYEYWMRLWCGGVKFYHLKEFLYFYRKNPNSLTATKFAQVQEKTLKLKLMYWDKVPLSSFGKCCALYKTYKKSGTPEMLQKIYDRHPILGRIIKMIKGKRKCKKI